MKPQLNKAIKFSAILLWLSFTPFLCFASPIPHGYSMDSLLNDPPGIVLNMESRLELFVDDYLIDHFIGRAELRLHHPDPKEIVMVHDQPWEGSGSLYHCIFRDGEKYRMYYRGTQLTVTEGKLKTNDHPSFICYAESNDGIHWVKPNLRDYEFRGSKENNIIFIRGMMDSIHTDGIYSAVFKDGNPNADADALYRAILLSHQPKGLLFYKSPDGIEWNPVSSDPVITDGSFDSQNLAFWDGVNGEYRAYWRYFDQADETSIYRGTRCIRTAKSKDLINWYDQEDLSYVDSPLEQLYTNQIIPYYRAPHIFMGFPTRYTDRGWSESMRALPEPEHRELRSSANPRYGTAVTEALFMASRDGELFKRWNEAFLRPGIEREGTWQYGQQYIGWSFVETRSELEGAPNELSFYASESYWTGNSSALRRYTLRIDGFVSLSAPMSGGEMITKPLNFTGSRLVINFSSSAAGDIRVEIQDENGIPIPGFTLEECPPVFGDTLERTVTWESGSDLSSLEGKTIRLRIVLRDADLYSLRFK